MMDSTIMIKDLVKTAKNRGHTHIAMTDHGNLHGAIDFYLTAQKEKITPIIGCELFCQPFVLNYKFLKEHKDILPSDDKKIYNPFHIVVLAKNTRGYHNLLKLVSQGYIGDKLKDIPVVSYDDFKKYGKDLIALSSCTRGEFANLVKLLKSKNDPDELLFSESPSPQKIIFLNALRNYVEKITEIFGPDHYYVELIDNNLIEQKLLLPSLVEAAKYFSLPIVASADAHYLEPEFANTHALALAIKNGLTMRDIRERMHTSRFHLCSDEEMTSIFSRWPEAITNTQRIAEECSDVFIDMGTYHLPKINLGSKENPQQALERLSRKGLELRLSTLEKLNQQPLNEKEKKSYWDRLDFEIKIISQMGFCDYFLIVQDFICWAKDQNIPVGPGRGSGAGSLVAYSLKITDIDPLPYNLIFERFLNPERVSMPDFDVDFCQWRREEVIQYCVDKYGSNNVAQITTFGKMQAKGAVKSVGRALNLSFLKLDRFTKLFPPDLGINLQQVLEKEPLIQQEMDRDESLNEAMNYALQLEGLISHTSVHAAGLVMSDKPMTDYLPIYTTDGKSYITQFEMKPTEKVGLVKFDFLGLKTLTVIARAVDLVSKETNKKFDISQIPLADNKVYQMLSKGITCGVFQCESLGMTQLIKKLKPMCFEEIIALVALFRPGPLGSGMVDDFIERKHGRQAIVHLHPLLEPILKETYGMILYQEQVQKIAATLANYSLGEADLLRRAMGKKIPEEMAKQKTRFMEGSQKNKIPDALAEEIFDLMAEFAKYGFNKSHSAAYGLISYQTAYLKCYYPAQYMAAIMTFDMDNTDKVKRYVEECKQLQLEILPPNINRSYIDFDVPQNNQVGFALAAIKGVGEGIIKTLLEEREIGGPYTSPYHLAQRVHLGKLGKKTLELLVQSGSCDDFKISRKKMISIIPKLVKYSTEYHESKSQGQRGLFDDLEETTDLPSVQEEEVLSSIGSVWSLSDLFEERKVLGVFLTGHPIDYFKEDFSQFNQTIESFLPMVKNFKPRQKKPVSFISLIAAQNQRRTKKGTLMTSVRFEQSTSFLEGVIFENQGEDIEIPETNTLVIASGNIEKSMNEDSVRFQITNVRPLESTRKERVKAINLRLLCQLSEKENFLAKLIKETIIKYPGKTPIKLSIDFKSIIIHLNTEQEYKVNLSNNFMSEIKDITKNEVAIDYL